MGPRGSTIWGGTWERTNGEFVRVGWFKGTLRTIIEKTSKYTICKYFLISIKINRYFIWIKSVSFSKLFWKVSSILMY